MTGLSKLHDELYRYYAREYGIESRIPFDVFVDRVFVYDVPQGILYSTYGDDDEVQVDFDIKRKIMYVYDPETPDRTYELLRLDTYEAWAEYFRDYISFDDVYYDGVKKLEEAKERLKGLQN